MFSQPGSRSQSQRRFERPRPAARSIRFHAKQVRVILLTENCGETLLAVATTIVRLRRDLRFSFFFANGTDFCSRFRRCKLLGRNSVPGKLIFIRWEFIPVDSRETVQPICTRDRTSPTSFRALELPNGSNRLAPEFHFQLETSNKSIRTTSTVYHRLTSLLLLILMNAEYAILKFHPAESDAPVPATPFNSQTFLSCSGRRVSV